MHIRQSDTTYDDVDHDIDLSAAANEAVLSYLKRSDLDMHRSNPWAGPVTVDVPELRA